MSNPIMRFFFLILIGVSQANAQFSDEIIISQETLGAWTVFAGDIDGDELPDVVSANRFGNDVTWFKNLGNGEFGPLILIASLDQPLDVTGADLDGDGDLDILATAVFSNLVVWYQNMNGIGAFSSQNVISNETIGVNDVQVADIDDDGDLDLVTGSDSSGVAWHENIDGQGNFAPKQIINDNISSARAVAVVDIDNDNDLDVVATSSGNFTLSWYENLDGLGDFGEIQILSGSALAKTAVFGEDINGDGFVDLVSATFAENKIEWFQNMGGSGNFASPQIITTEAEGAISVFVSDLDNDGDMDVLSASRNDNKVAWYENFTVLSVDDDVLKKIEIYPNPTEDVLTISTPDNVSLDSIRILDVSGKTVREISAPNRIQIDIRGMTSGIYFLELSAGSSTVTKKILVK